MRILSPSPSGHANVLSLEPWTPGSVNHIDINETSNSKTTQFVGS